jgi:Cu-processing system permease protein
MRALRVLAGRELRDGLRNRWVLAVTLLLAALALALAFVGSVPVGQVGAAPLEVVVVSLASLSILLLPLIALLLSFDAVVGEAERGTLLLLLAGPVLRWQVVLGKFLGQVAILTVATVLGYGAAALAVAARSGVPDAAATGAFATLIGSSVLLGAAFVALGLLVSVLVRERQTAAGAALGLWLVAAVIYDLALLGALVADAGRRVTPGLLEALLLLNPADAFRLLNLTGFAGVQALSGMAGLAGEVSPSVPAVTVGVLLAWTVLPLVAATLVFARREP